MVVILFFFNLIARSVGLYSMVGLNYYRVCFFPAAQIAHNILFPGINRHFDLQNFYIPGEAAAVLTARENERWTNAFSPYIPIRN